MKKSFEKLLSKRGETLFVQILFSWQMWLLGALLGAIVGGILIFILPTQYRVHATVLVDQNTEEAWFATDEKNKFYYLDVENRKLEAVAWGDAVMHVISEVVPNVDVVALRNNQLKIVRQYDGIWEFHVIDKDREKAEQIAGAWAVAFSEEVMSSLEFQVELESLRAEYTIIQAEMLWEREYADNKVSPELRKAFLENDEFFKEIVFSATGISPYVEIVPTSVKNLPYTEQPIGGIVLLGAVVSGALLMAIVFIFMFSKEEEDEK